MAGTLIDGKQVSRIHRQPGYFPSAVVLAALPVRDAGAKRVGCIRLPGERGQQRRGMARRGRCLTGCREWLMPLRAVLMRLPCCLSRWRLMCWWTLNRSWIVLMEAWRARQWPGADCVVAVTGYKAAAEHAGRASADGDVCGKHGLLREYGRGAGKVLTRWCRLPAMPGRPGK